MDSYITWVDTLNISSTNLRSEQSQAILRAISEGCKLTYLDLSHNYESSVERGVLTRAVTGVITLYLSRTMLTTDQAETVLNVICQGSTLKKLNIHVTSLSGVNPDLMARAVNKLERVEIIGRPHLTSQKISLILTNSLVMTSLISLNIGYGGYGINQAIIKQVRCKYTLSLM